MGSLSKKNCFYAFKWSCFFAPFLSCWFLPALQLSHLGGKTTLSKVFSTKLQKLSDNIYSTKLLSGIKVVSDVIHYNECIRKVMGSIRRGGLLLQYKETMFYAFSTSPVVMEYVSQVGRVSKGPFICIHGLQGLIRVS